MGKKLISVETGLDKVGYKNVEPASGQTVYTSQWFTLNANGEGILATDTHRLVFLAFAGMERPDVVDDAVNLVTGGLTGIYGKFIATVGIDGYDGGGTYALDKPLKIVNGKLVDGVDGTDIIVARAMGALVNAQLTFACDVPVIVADI